MVDGRFKRSLWVVLGFVSQTQSFHTFTVVLIPHPLDRHTSTKHRPSFIHRSHSPLHAHRRKIYSHQSAGGQISTLRERDPLETSLTNIADGGASSVDNILKDLVSPAPESFHVIDITVKKINVAKSNLQNVLLDIEALSRYLVKPNCVIQVYEEENIWKWDTAPAAQADGKTMIRCKRAGYDLQFRKSFSELYHNLTSLELARFSIDVATGKREREQSTIEEIVKALEKRLALTLGSDLRGRTSADAAFQLALSGAAQSSHIFDALVNVGIHELNRAGYRSSFKPIYVLQMVEKFAACGIKSSSVKELYYTAGLCLEAKGHHDAVLIDSLKKDDFGLHSDRPLLWLWRFSARQKKITLNDNGHKYNTFGSNFSWDDYFHDTSKGLVVDIGCGCGVSLLNLSRIDKNEVLLGNQDDVPGMEWSDYNYAGIDLNKQLVDYANGVVSRLNHNDGGRINFFCSPAIELLKSLQIYAGRIEIIMIQFPSPYRLSSEEPRDGNSQLPSTSTEGYMISRDVVQVISKLLKKNNGTLLLQTKCEDVAVYTKNLFLEGGDLECLPCSSTVWNIDNIYERNQLSRPQRVNKWLRQCPEAERAEGEIWSSRPLLPLIGRTETEVNCDFENTHVHRFKISSKKGEFIKNKNLK